MGSTKKASSFAWRINNPEKSDLSIKRHHAKRASARILKEAQFRSRLISRRQKMAIAKQIEAGKDLGHLAIGLGITVSRLKAIYEEYKHSLSVRDQK